MYADLPRAPWVWMTPLWMVSLILAAGRGAGSPKPVRRSLQLSAPTYTTHVGTG